MAFDPPPPQDDGLLVPDVGPWSADKHYFLGRYLDAFTTAMRKKRWNGLHYIDLFAGAGIENVQGKGLDWGSPLLAAQLPHQFSRLHLCELMRTKFEALRERLPRFVQSETPQLICGDANVEVVSVVEAIPPRSLSVAFLDPYGLDLHFDTLGQLASRRVDLIIFFPDHLDALRNCRYVYEETPDSKLDRVLGTTTWRAKLDTEPPDRWASLFSELYVEQIRTLGYDHFEYERVTMPNGRFLYRLIFCSRDATGTQIWRNVARDKANGQRGFDY